MQFTPGDSVENCIQNSINEKINMPLCTIIEVADYSDLLETFDNKMSSQ